jgi:hypothetical protein
MTSTALVLGWGLAICAASEAPAVQLPFACEAANFIVAYNDGDATIVT